MSYLAITILIGVFVALVWRFRAKEKAEWNNGVCAKSGMAWECFDMDSQGGRMYKDGCGNYCDISYSVDKYPQEMIR